jgi:hypothetical protein
MKIIMEFDSPYIKNQAQLQEMARCFAESLIDDIWDELRLNMHFIASEDNKIIRMLDDHDHCHLKMDIEP